MTMAFSDDLAAFFDLDDFAEVVQVDGVDVTVIFDFPSLDVEQVTTTLASATLPTTEAADISEGAVLVRNGVRYVVDVPPHHNGTGTTVLSLSHV